MSSFAIGDAVVCGSVSATPTSTDVIRAESYAGAELAVADAAELRGAALASEGLEEAKRAQGPLETVRTRVNADPDEMVGIISHVATGIAAINDTAWLSLDDAQAQHLRDTQRL